MADDQTDAQDARDTRPDYDTATDEEKARIMQEMAQEDYNERVWGGRIVFGPIIPGTEAKGKATSKPKSRLNSRPTNRDSMP